MTTAPVSAPSQAGGTRLFWHGRAESHNLAGQSPRQATVWTEFIEDAKFIAHDRTDLPALLGAVEETLEYLHAQELPDFPEAVETDIRTIIARHLGVKP